MSTPSLVDISPPRRSVLRSLYADFPGLEGCVAAALSGEMGTAVADDADVPRTACIHLDFYLLAGDPETAAAAEIVAALPRPASVVAARAGWAALLERILGNELTSRQRVAFSPGTWQRDRLQEMMRTLPAGFELRRITTLDAERFRTLADSLVYNFRSLDDFIARGAGFGVEHDGVFVSGCSSFAIGGGKLEFEIQTHPEFRRRGLAMATAAALIEYCLEQRLEPCWDAHNEMSASMALKLGFVDPRPYTAYQLAAR